MQAEKIWEAALGQLQLQVSKANYNTWLKDSRGVSYVKGIFTVAVPTAFIAEWLRGRLHPTICRILSAITGSSLEVDFQVMSGTPAAAPQEAARQPDGGISLKARRPLKGNPLNPRLSFNTFIPGDCNKLPYTAAMEVAGSPGESYNPLFIYGGTGTGKTHLLHAARQVMAARGVECIFISAEQFTNEFVAAIRGRTAEEFRCKFCEADVLMIDDIQFLGGKAQTQECIFYILDDFLSAGKQVIISSDRPPKDIDSFNLRLRSRLEGGLVADIYTPDHKTRLSILELKSRQLKAEFDASVLNFLSANFHNNVRELEGALTRLATYSRMDGSAVDVTTAKRLLSDMLSLSRESGGHYPSAQIIGATADYFSLSPEDLAGKRRDAVTSRARHVAMYLLRQQNHANLAEIGRLLGNRDHSTVIHGCEKIASALASDASLSKALEAIRAMLKSQRPA